MAFAKQVVPLFHTLHVCKVCGKNGMKVSFGKNSANGNGLDSVCTSCWESYDAKTMTWPNAKRREYRDPAVVATEAARANKCAKGLCIIDACEFAHLGRHAGYRCAEHRGNKRPSTASYSELIKMGHLLPIDVSSPLVDRVEQRGKKRNA